MPHYELGGSAARRRSGGQSAPTDGENYWRGYYDACRMLDRSVRMNRPQREVIYDQAAKARRELEQRGVKFAADSSEPDRVGA